MKWTRARVMTREATLALTVLVVARRVKRMLAVLVVARRVKRMRVG
jgi:hypothetical protein